MNWIIGSAPVATALTALATLYFTIHGRFHRVNEALVLLRSATDAKLSDEVVKELTEIAERRVRGYVDSDAKERYRFFWWMTAMFSIEAVALAYLVTLQPLYSLSWYGNVTSTVIVSGCAIAMPFVRRYVRRFEARQSVERRLSL